MLGSWTVKAMFFSALMVWLSLGAAAFERGERDPDKREWIQLFNGRDLAGWDIKIAGHDLNDNYGKTFRVEDSLLKVGYEGYQDFAGRFGHIFYRHTFSHYRLAVEYRFTGSQIAGGPSWGLRNSGVMIHSQPAWSMLRDQDFPICIEVQFLGQTGPEDRPTANLCTPGTNVVMSGRLVTDHCIPSTSPTFSADQWVRVEVLVLGSDRIEHIVNGKTVLAYEKPQLGGPNVRHYDESWKEDGTLLSEGYIALQSESHPIEFRKVEILPLAGCVDPRAVNYKSYYRKADNSSCLYELGR